MYVCVYASVSSGGKEGGGEGQRERSKTKRASKTKRDTLYMRGRWKDWMPGFGKPLPSATNS
jgi:hypothetical protein